MARTEHSAPQPRRRKGERGLTLIELMIALTVFAVGLGGTMILITTAAASNGRSKVDTTGTMLAQMVLDQYAAMPARTGSQVVLTDCAGNTLTLNSVDVNGGAGTGATLTGTNQIDYTQNFADVTAGYAGTYTGCGVGGRRPVYQVRVHVRNFVGVGGIPYTKLVIVSARRTGVTGTTSLRFFAPPVTLRTMVGS